MSNTPRMTVREILKHVQVITDAYDIGSQKAVMELDHAEAAIEKLLNEREVAGRIFGAKYAKQEIMRENEGDAIFNINSFISNQLNNKEAS